MQIVINMTDDFYKHFMYSDDFGDDDDIAKLIDVVAGGTPLPKGHGRLGDLDALRDEVSSWGMNDYEPSDFTDAIDEADTIIEADKEQTDNGDND